MYTIIKSSIVCVALCSMLVLSAFAAQLTVDGERIIIKTDTGEVIDTANLPKGEKVKTENNIDIIDNGISIGSVTGNNSDKENIKRSTNLENVIIINNGKTTIYNPTNQ